MQLYIFILFGYNVTWKYRYMLYIVTLLIHTRRHCQLVLVKCISLLVIHTSYRNRLLNIFPVFREKRTYHNIKYMTV